MKWPINTMSCGVKEYDIISVASPVRAGLAARSEESHGWDRREADTDPGVGELCTLLLLRELDHTGHAGLVRDLRDRRERRAKHR